ncbi:MAG: trypsin-like peptidase domain-containing protein [Chloroflexi bacterium]|nr:trypsin-like peptidase domain-containing protein [Chloroflexota bacterium]MDA1003090.1 trypsin-like peptidase domain-containing protein [Chloroflexota bacterium]MQC27724.1 PDZ domain-containing protein [Chloroflexota bacterium]
MIGGLIVRAGDDPPAPAPTATAVIATPAPADAERMRSAIARVLPTVVTVLATLPSQAVTGGVLERENFGSGIVIASGYVMTNYHVVDGASNVQVVLSTGERREATVIADDSPFHDLAILSVRAQGLRVATLGDSDALQLGDPVAAISGGLVTFENQAKVGVVSTLHLAFPRSGLIMEDMIQTDAAVNHGDSGGALINRDGEVVGVLTTVVRTTPGGQIIEGVGLAHSVNSLRAIIDAVVATGANPRLRYGIERVGTQHVPVTDELAAQRGLPVRSGALIIDVPPTSPAGLAGVRNGDIVVGVDGFAVDNTHPLVNQLAGLAGDGRAEFQIIRDGAQVVVGVMPRAGG